MLKKGAFLLLFFVGFLSLSAQNSAIATLGSGLEKAETGLNRKIDEIIKLGKTFLGKPYRFQSGSLPWALDCSGFVCYIFKENGYSIPRSSSGIAPATKKIQLKDIQKGDLMFFKGRNINSNTVGHVSLVIDVDPVDGIKMMHSCSRGIIIEDYEKIDYYKKRFLMAGRIPEFSEELAQKATSLAQSSKVIQPAKKKNAIADTLSIIGVGDIMLGTNYPSASYLPPNDGKEILSPVKDILSSADITFGNLEGVLLTGNGPVKKCSNPAVCYAFKSPDHYAGYLKDAGFDVLSIANNHVGDFGDMGRKNTVKVLNEQQIYYAGLLDFPYTTFEKNGVKYGFCAFAPNTGTVSINDIENAKKIVQHLDSISDIVIVSFHGGAEGAANRNITRKTETYLGENRGNPYAFSRAVIDAGADIVFGHGPHVTRAIDIYKNRIIAYSLGNFATYGRFNLKEQAGIAPILKVNVNAKGEFLSGQIYPIKQEGEGGPVLDPDNKVIQEIIKLTKTDIPEVNLIIQENGLILKKNQ